MRSIFTALKDMPPTLLFITGVMPLLLTELSSASNDIAVLTHDRAFAGAMGLPQAAVERELRRIAAWVYRNSEDRAAVESAFVAEMGIFMKVRLCPSRFSFPSLRPLDVLLSANSIHAILISVSASELLQRLPFRGLQPAKRRLATKHVQHAANHSIFPLADR